jgi:flagellar assembly protein FliH
MSSTVTTDRFHWQGAELAMPPTLGPALHLTSSPGPTAVTPALRDLPAPSTSVERVEAIEREAYARGYADGARDVESAATERVEGMTAHLAGAIQSLAAVRGVLMRRSERDLVRLAVAIAERVLRHEIDVDRERLVVMARAAIDRLGDHTAATIHLNPVDFEGVRAHHDLDLGASIEVLADPTVPRGGCVVRSSFGTIDAGIDAQMRELSRALLGDATEDQQGGFDDPSADA